MQIDFFGANCIRIKTKQTSIVFDDNLSDVGAKSITKDDDASVNTNPNILGSPKKKRIEFIMPGEYEVGDIMLTGIAAQAHMDEKGTRNATIYRGIVDDIRFVVLGHIAGELSEEQLEAIGVVDVAFIPVGGNGYTLDATAAAKLAKQLEARLVIPTHYESKGLKYEVSQVSPDEFITQLGVEKREVNGSTLKLKRSDLSEKQEIALLS